VTIGLGICGFLLAVHCNHASILHGYEDTGLQRFWGHEFDLLGSSDVIGHVTIGLGICGFLLVVRCNHASILHRYGNMGPKDIEVTTLTFWGHVTSSITWPSDSAWAISYWWSMMTMRLSCTYTEIQGFKDFGVTSLTFWGQVTSSVTWPLDSAYVVSYWWSIGIMHLSCTVTEILGPKIKGSRVWPFGVTWRHRSRDHWTRRGHFPISGQWWPCVYLAQIRRYGASKILGLRVWPFAVTWRHRSRDHSTRHMRFPIGGPLEPCVYLAPLRRYKASKLHLPMLKAKSSLRMLRVTWPVGSGSKVTTYLEFPGPHCLFTIQLLWGYDDD